MPSLALRSRAPRPTFGEYEANSVACSGSRRATCGSAMPGGKLAPRCDNCNEAIVVGVVCLGVGSAVDWLVSGRKVFKIGKKNKLRLLDLTPKPEVKPV